jgi:prepilin-type processing-associated H-X9-DG protein
MMVVIVLIGMLAAALLPAVQGARETARRSACANNLKQLALAIHKYESASGSFPAIQMYPYATAKLNSGWMPPLLPHLEQNDLYNRFRRDLHWYDTLNQTAVTTRVRAFECPSSPVTAANRVITGTGAGAWPTETYHGATTDYVASGGLCGSIMIPTYAPDGTDALNCGAMALDTGRRMSEIPDGTSNTLLIAEMAGRSVLWQNGRPDTTSTVISSNLNICGAWAAANYLGFRGFTYDGTIQPGAFGVNAANRIGGIYSFHSNGANAAMADASVHFLKQDLDILVLVAMITREGHEVIDAADHLVTFGDTTSENRQ